MYKIHLNPYLENKVWGGNKLAEFFNSDKTNIGEAFIVSTIKGKESYLDNGLSLSNFVSSNLKELGLNSLDEFPVLIKLIDAADDLSIQVHPDDTYAISKGLKKGKFEMWYILKETKNNKIIFGLKNIERSKFEKAIHDGKILDYINYLDIKEKDILKVTPGTVHAILKNTFLLEVQDPSNVTYRLFDYNRIPKRELHVEDSLNVIYKKKDVVDTNKFTIEEDNNYFFIKINGFCKFFFQISKKQYNTFLVINE